MQQKKVLMEEARLSGRKWERGAGSMSLSIGELNCQVQLLAWGCGAVDSLLTPPQQVNSSLAGSSVPQNPEGAEAPHRGESVSSGIALNALPIPGLNPSYCQKLRQNGRVCNFSAV